MGGAISIIAYVIPAGLLTRRAPLRRIKRLGAELSRRFCASQLRTLQRRLQALRQAQEEGADGRPEGGGVLPSGASAGS